MDEVTRVSKISSFDMGVNGKLPIEVAIEPSHENKSFNREIHFPTMVKRKATATQEVGFFARTSHVTCTKPECGEVFAATGLESCL